MAPRIIPFDAYASEYDGWFKENKQIFRSELQAVRMLMPRFDKALEVGVGTGRFAGSLGIQTGVEPSGAMADLARNRGITVVRAVAEALPFVDQAFELLLMVTTICFLDDLDLAFRETHRVLTGGGHFVLGFLDRDTESGRVYEERRNRSRFYRDARFRSSGEVLEVLRQSGFCDTTSVQTIFGSPDTMQTFEPVKPGHGTGLFVVMRGRKPTGVCVSRQI
ncbi:methyltransferase domain-containing protein [bacterium]|nr:methyltransferase domain-containing protein [candidate division CSSED10-310 bacterium]